MKSHSFRPSHGAFRTVIVALAAVALIAGAGMPALAQSKSSAKSVDSLDKVIKEMTKGRGQIQGAMDSLAALTSGSATDLPKLYKTYSKNVADIGKTAESVRSRMEDLKANREAYLAEWQKKTSEISSPEIQAHMKQREEEVRKVFDSMQPARDAAKENFPPFLNELQDIDKLLSVDLSPSGVASAKPIADQAVSHGTVVVQSLDSLTGTLTQIRDNISAKGGK